MKYLFMLEARLPCQGPLQHPLMIGRESFATDGSPLRSVFRPSQIGFSLLQFMMQMSLSKQAAEICACKYLEVAPGFPRGAARKLPGSQSTRPFHDQWGQNRKKGQVLRCPASKELPTARIRPAQGLRPAKFGAGRVIMTVHTMYLRRPLVQNLESPYCSTDYDLPSLTKTGNLRSF